MKRRRKESEAGDEKEGEVELENVVESSDQVFADLPREDHVTAGRSLPPAGKAGPPSPRVLGEGGERGVQVVPDKAGRVKGEVKKSDIKVQASSSSSSSSSSETLYVGDISHLGDSGEWTTVLPRRKQEGKKKMKEGSRSLFNHGLVAAMSPQKKKCPSF